MLYLAAIVFGIIEGLTEFLPVSSTAHLRLAKPLFGIALNDPYWKMFDVVIQLGAVMCLPVYFAGRINKFVRTFPRGESGNRNAVTHPLSLVFAAFVCTAIPAFALKKLISANLESATVIGAALLIGGAVMWAVDALFTRPHIEHIETMKLPHAIWIGLLQTLAAVFPGTSRSMVTIAAGQTAGMTRAAALEFSFFLSMPTMAAATLYDLYKSINPGHDDIGLAPGTMTFTNWILLAIGFVVSFIVSLLVVAWFMGWVRRRGLTPFAIYRVVLGIGVLIWARSQQ